MAIEWNKVTWYSKLAAVAVFLATFLVAFNLGVLWEQTHIETALSETPVAPDGQAGSQSSVGGAGASCGGFIRNAPTCRAGFHCKLGAIADKGGVCVPN
ncbi:hypothetical protein KGQ25_00895 [Patescibacteria group bacterium]|nr:hypothetical protein [Patescibacteria group bacterium]MDE2021612.1 hypothetical protein [Patescibacteria group bacterium]